MANVNEEQEVIKNTTTEEATGVVTNPDMQEDNAPAKEEHHSPKYYDYKEYYETGRWTLSMLKVAVKKGAITPEEYKEITGRDYK